MCASRQCEHRIGGPRRRICELAHPTGLVHVDAAFGLWAKASPSLAPLVRESNRPIPGPPDAHKC